MKWYKRIQQTILLDLLLIGAGLGVHLWYLAHTTFVDWPEMLLYPWFLTKGLVYYRDVVLAYVPGAYYLLYALYKVIGFSVASERIVAYGCILLTDVMVYIAARVLTRKTWISIAAFFFFIFWQPIYSGNTIWYETILAPIYLVAYLAALRYLDTPKMKAACVVGCILALSTLIKQTAIWSVATVCLFFWLSNADKKQGFLHACVIGMEVIVANLLVWGYFAFLGAGSQYGFWAFGFLLNLSQGNSMYTQFPTRADLTLILPSLIPIGILLWLRPNKKVWLLLALTLAVFLSGLPRWGLHRFQPMLGFIAVGFGVVVSQIASSRRRSLITPVIILTCFMALGSWRSIRVFITLRDTMQPQFFDGQYQKLLSFTQANTQGPIYILGNYDYLYFGRNERPAVLPWVPLFPWNGRVPGLQQQLIVSLEDQKIPYILYIPFHPKDGYYLDYMPRELLLYVTEKYEKIGPLPIEGGLLYQRR